MSSVPNIPAIHQKRDRGCLALSLSLVLLIVGGGVFWRFFYDPIITYLQSQRWVKTPCTVFYPDSDPDKKAGKDRPLLYRYTYAGKPHWHARIWFFKPDANEVDAIQKRYPPGDYECYVNPEKPEVAILERDFRPQLLLALFPLALAIISLGGLVSHFRRHTVESFVETYARQRRRATTGPDGKVTQRKGRGLSLLLSVMVFAAAYNGVLYFLIREVIDTWSEGFPGCHGLFLTGFAIPFVAVGIGAIVAAIYLLLKLFNPRPTLTLSTATVRLGSSIDISWGFAGRIGRIRRLRIVVEGREEATYTRGAKFYTDREIFASIELLNTKDIKVIPRGQAGFTMPALAVPSFRSANNSISWAVRIHGHVRRWPDVETEVELNVIPAPETAEVPA